ncbi:FtsW/RodA/SpoVE family cell cycle protein [Paenibacillus sp. J22TS3]|uniref:FtsW/RodA/SpoVE family cell cycle protein n=1 Tax=Paenibacillus sp. J22TS3 TaxID=2807192 RepID=UPI001B01D019|nr:FtsW/RodA/SpoVE family cell cycle protein [Paenibacillus sp. J22TS3]GIP21224.1 cell division protein FtsW [Paenibacillus sp. J22TS3]
MIITVNELRDRFLAEVCGYVKAREVHTAVKEELGSHLTELAEERIADGYDSVEAWEWAVGQMGEPAVLGKQFNRVYKPRVHYGLIISVIILVAISVLTLLSVHENYAGSSQQFYQLDFPQRQVVFLTISIIIMLVVCFFDYRKLYRWSWHLYILMIIGYVYIYTFNSPVVNGVKRYILIGPIGLDWANISSYCFVVALAGIARQISTFGYRPWKSKLILSGAFLAPVFIYVMLAAASELAFYLFTCGILYIWMYRDWKAPVSAFLIGAAALYYYAATSTPYSSISRIVKGALDPYADPKGFGYAYVQMREAIRSSGWWGHGFGAPLNKVPFLHSEGIVTYLIYCFGWAAGIALAFIVVLFIRYMIAAFRKLDDSYGKALFLIVSVILGSRMLYSAAMATGLVPILGIVFPFLSYGGSHLFVEFAAVGLLLGIYRRKDMVRATSRFDKGDSILIDK